LTPVSNSLPAGFKPFFQEYDLTELDPAAHADLIIQRILEYGDWEDIRWLFEIYGAARIRLFLRKYGERWLQPVAFNYWRKLLKVQRWQRSPLPTPKGDLWKF